MVDLFVRMREFNVLICHVWHSTFIPEGEDNVPSLLTDGFIAIQSKCLVPPEYAYNIIEHDHVLYPLPQYLSHKALFESEWKVAKDTNRVLDIIGPVDQSGLRYPPLFFKGSVENQTHVFAYNSAKVYWVLKRLGGGPMDRFRFYYGAPTAHPETCSNYCTANLLIERETLLCASIGPVHQDVVSELSCPV